MKMVLRTCPVAVLALACMACQPSGTQDGDTRAGSAGDPGAGAQPPADDVATAGGSGLPVLPAAPTPTPPVVEGAQTTYLCGGGELHVVYARGQARVTFADGRELTLTIDPQASRPGGGEVFANGVLGLHRSGNTVVLREPGQGEQVCSESSSTA
jgi:hypothetical protein